MNFGIPGKVEYGRVGHNVDRMLNLDKSKNSTIATICYRVKGKLA